MSKYSQLMRKFKLELSALKYAQSTIDTYSSCLGIFLKAMNGKPKPLPFDCVKEFLGFIQNQHYHKQFTATIRHFYNLVLQQPFNAKDIPYPRPTEYLPEVFSVQEVDALVNSYSNLKHRSIIQLMYSCGLRIGEVVGIKLEHINSQRSTIRIKNGKGFKDRDVPIPAATLQLLKCYYAAEKLKPKVWLFEGQFKEQYTTRSIQQVFRQGVNKLGIRRNVKPHSLRHSRATHLHEAGVDIKDIADFLGHQNIETTANYYLKLSKLTLINRIINADALLANSLNSKTKLIA